MESHIHYSFWESVRMWWRSKVVLEEDGEQRLTEGD